MIRISQLKMPLGHSGDGLRAKAAKSLRVRENRIKHLNIVKQSVDARKKPEIRYSYVVDVTLSGLDAEGEKQLVHRLRDRGDRACGIILRAYAGQKGLPADPSGARPGCGRPHEGRGRLLERR